MGIDALLGFIPDSLLNKNLIIQGILFLDSFISQLILQIVVDPGRALEISRGGGGGEGGTT